MFAPNVVVALDGNEQRELAAFYRDQPVVLIFLRHFGCIFCREQVAQLRTHPEWNVLFVTMGTQEEATEFRASMESPHRFISDPNKRLYEDFGLRRGSFGQMFSPRTFRRGFQATRAGHSVGKPVGDPWQLSGAFLIGQDGRILGEHRSSDASDNLSVDDIGAWLSTVSIV